MTLFDKRVNMLPYEYPHLIDYGEAIQHSYWLFSEYNFTADISEFKTKLSDSEREAIKRTMLAISQIEISVKTFWGKLYDRMPKSEIGIVGGIFSESECRHMMAYSHLITLLGLQDEFEGLVEVPAIANRIKYLNKYLDGTRSRDNRMYTKSILLFSIFIEYISLFSQFLIMLSFNKEHNSLKGIANVVEATMQEEDLHGKFGIEIINILRKEYPEWFDDDFEKIIISACKKAFKAECGVIDWIFEKGELSFLSKDEVKEFIKNRLNVSLKAIGYDDIFEIDDSLLEKSNWIEVQLKSTAEGDFFNKRETSYFKKSKSVTHEDLF